MQSGIKYVAVKMFELLNIFLIYGKMNSFITYTKVRQDYIFSMINKNFLNSVY